MSHTSYITKHTIQNFNMRLTFTHNLAPKTPLNNNMKKTHKQDDIEILKAVAQAWHSHSSSTKTTSTTSEFDAQKRFSKAKPTRFKIEAMSKKDQCWDFRQSLWDSYEILSVSKKLERGLVLDYPSRSISKEEHGKNDVKRRKESKNSLRSLFNIVSSRRFSYADLPSDHHIEDY